jgi:hypothetical protein
MVSLDALEDDSITSASGLSSSIDSSLSSNLVTNLAADGVSVSGLTVTTFPDNEAAFVAKANETLQHASTWIKGRCSASKTGATIMAISHG